jgi:hypothetical protein
MNALTFAAAFLLAGSSFGQGTIYFSNRALPYVDAPVSRPDGTGAGAGVTAQLFLVGAAGELMPLFPTTTFRTFSPATTYYVNAVNITVPTIGPLQPATVRMRAWEGSSYETATLRGESNDIRISRLGDPIPCPFIQCWETGYLTGLQPFTLTVPEPQPLTLTLAAALLLFSRFRSPNIRKQ